MPYFNIRKHKSIISNKYSNWNIIIDINKISFVSSFYFVGLPVPHFRCWRICYTTRINNNTRWPQSRNFFLFYRHNTQIPTLITPMRRCYRRYKHLLHLHIECDISTLRAWYLKFWFEAGICWIICWSRC